ncbi:hypothetical protein L484_024027 [Morus notabilis]|uniref:Uncharacterized protein n=1 Tax=Morus notabilis TaxID=981085 RepID=W9SE81_9ROSA|nr:hypothetical protein L484_024027 [Morus notabilis]
MVDERAKLAEERAKKSKERYEKLLRTVKMAENQKSSDLVAFKRKNGELESAKKGLRKSLSYGRENLGSWRNGFCSWRLIHKIINAENRAILIIDSNDDCAPGATSCTKDDVLKRKRSS